MGLKTLVTAFFLTIVLPVMGCAHSGTGGLVDVRIISDSGSEFSQHRTYPRIRQEGRYFYVEAVKSEKYSIRVSNRSARSVGVVIAVDGRNIISGSKSDLRQSERMYIIEPYVTQTFEGWRTGMDRTNRFYFTEQADSYAERAFSDGSAMGTIAVAVYKEKADLRYFGENEIASPRRSSPGAGSPAPAETHSADRHEKKKSEQAGTGFGETTYSPVRIVHFEAEPRVAEKIVLKYEWRTELCRKGVIACEPKNRLWPGDGGFAPAPRDFHG
jgi:hypothetical protein